MSKITICIEEEKTKNIKIYDENNNEQFIDVKIIEYHPQKDNWAYLQTDYFGNIYLKHKDKYYTVSLDSYESSGIELNRIEKPDVFRKNLIESRFLKNAIKTGVIKANSTSLSGKVYESMNDMTEEELEEYMSKNNFSTFDSSFHEKKHFWVQYDEEDEPLEGTEDDGFYLNGIYDGDYIPDNLDQTQEQEKAQVQAQEQGQGICYSDLLAYCPGSFDTILMQGDMSSKRVLSNTERIDGYCTTRLTVYTSGHFRANFIDFSKLSRLCMITQPITNENKTQIQEQDTILVMKKIGN